MRVLFLSQVLALCGASFLLGRCLQLLMTDSNSETAGDDDEVLSVKQRLIEMFLLPTGTWGFGPVLNGLIWFSLFAHPTLLYPATPTGMTAPVWTAAGIPVLLLCEDIFSIVDDRRRTEVSQPGAPQ